MLKNVGNECEKKNKYIQENKRWTKKEAILVKTILGKGNVKCWNNILQCRYDVSSIVGKCEAKLREDRVISSRC